MITKTETDELFDRFVADNTKYDNDRKRVLNNFRNSEKLLRKYIETLSDLEKQQSRANFSEFQLLQQNMVANLLQFDPRNIEGNIVYQDGEVFAKVAAGSKAFAGEEIRK